MKREAVSAENAELQVRMKAILAAYNRREWDAFFAELDPAYEWTPIEENVTYRGREAILEYHERWLEAWQEFEMELEHLEVAPTGDRGLAIVRYQGKSVASEVPIEGRFFQVGELRDGKPWRGKEYVDEAEARAAFEQRELADHAAIVRAAFEAFNAGGLDAVFAHAERYWHPEIEWLQPPEDVEGVVAHRGFNEVRRFFEQWFEAFADYAVELDGVRGAGEMVVALVHEHGHGRTSGLEVDWRDAYVFTFREDKVVRVEGFWDRAEALKAAGLSE